MYLVKVIFVQLFSYTFQSVELNYPLAVREGGELSSPNSVQIIFAQK